MGGLFSPGKPEALVPQDVQGLRAQQLQLLQQLLGLPSTGAGSGPAPPRWAVERGLAPAPTSSPSAPGPLGGGDVQSRLEQFFGPLSPFSAGSQTRTGVSQFVNQPSPEQRALDVAMPGLQEILSGGGPQYERDLAMANQEGGRFGSANAILRSEAHRNLLGARNQASQTLGLLSQGAGSGQARQAGFADQEFQRRLQILLNLLGVAQQTSFNVPISQSPSPIQQLGGIAQFIPGLGGGLGGGRGPGTDASGGGLV